MNTSDLVPNLRSVDRDTLYLLGGAAFVVIGASLLLSNRTVRRAINQINVPGLLSAAVPDIERFLRMRTR